MKILWHKSSARLVPAAAESEPDQIYWHRSLHLDAKLADIYSNIIVFFAGAPLESRQRKGRIMVTKSTGSKTTIFARVTILCLSAVPLCILCRPSGCLVRVHPLPRNTALL